MRKEGLREWGRKSPALETEELRACHGERPWGGGGRSSLQMGAGIIKAGQGSESWCKHLLVGTQSLLGAQLDCDVMSGLRVELVFLGPSELLGLEWPCKGAKLCHVQMT